MSAGARYGYPETLWNGTYYFCDLGLYRLTNIDAPCGYSPNPEGRMLIGPRYCWVSISLDSSSTTVERYNP